MKCQAGALTFFQSKKRMYFGLDEMESKLVYYRDKSDFDKKRDKLGVISLENSACTLIDGNPKGFIVHATGKKYEFEAENEKSAGCWLNSLQRRRDISDNMNIDSPIVNWSRSHSLPSDDIILPFSRPKRVKSFQKRRPSRYIQSKESTEDEVDPRRDNSKVLRVQSFNPSVLTRPKAPIRRREKSNNEAENDEHNSSSCSQRCVIAKKNQNLETIKDIPSNGPPNGEVLDHWITSWLNDQPCMNNSSYCADKSTLSDSREEDEEEEESTTTSEATSSYDSQDKVSLSADVQICNELNLLRMIDNRQKEKIHLLSAQKNELEQEIVKYKKIAGETSAILNGSMCNGTNNMPSLAAQNKFLNAEILRLNERCQTAEKRINEYTKRVEQLEQEMEEYKKEYVFVLQSCVRIPIREHSSCDNIQVKLFGGDIHENRVEKLLLLARESDPTLPTFESVTNPGTFHVDEYGFRHTFDNIPLSLHYICTQLHEFYQSRSDEYILRKQRWRQILEQEPCVIENNNEVRQLCRAGCPRAMRPKIWRVLIHQQVVDIKNKYGNYYYRNLCSSQGTPAEKHYCLKHQKQITLDLLRTMPNNVHFMSATCKGVTHLQAVLRAYCLHNPRMGYCQGMNFIAATALLFLSPEDAFWFLVAVTEKYFDCSYFDQALTGAQADQEVLKELLEQKYPRLAKHLEDHDIDLTTITLNWFIALFFDALPFQSMLRMWDCFLLEGPKVLFRFAIALLGLYQDEILDRSDTISVIKVLKAAVRLTYDIDGLIKYAFEELNPFPSKAQLHQKQAGYLAILQVRLHKRSQIRNMLDIVHTEADPSDKIPDMPIECLTFSTDSQGIGYIGIGNQRRGKLSMISFHKEASNLNILHLDFDCRPVSMTTFENGMGFISLLSGYVLALQLDNDNVSPTKDTSSNGQFIHHRQFTHHGHFTHRTVHSPFQDHDELSSG
uniref:TBC1 domain family member 2B n=1 Tax=Acrobeloides nanus TaxID=290746 RepID=A0A914DLM6_9BILA